MTGAGQVSAGLAAALALVAAPAFAAGDAAHGKMVFEEQCSGCHALSGPAVTAPSLAGVVGRKAGTAAGFSFSDAMAKSGVVWSEQSLDAFLTDPNKLISGTAMYGGMLADPKDRADVIAYLKSAPAP
jgi:cytochrome c